VVPPPPTVVSLVPNPLAIQQGATGTFTLTINAAQPTDTSIPLTNSAPSVLQAPGSATVPAGQTSVTFPVTGLILGSATVTATITASLNGGSASATVLVTPAELVTLTLSPQTATLFVGQTEPFTATGRFTDGTTQDLTTSVTWTSSNQSVATINASGVASALA